MIRHAIGRVHPLVLAACTLCLAACEDEVNTVPPYQVPADYAFVTTANASTGAAAVVSADTLLSRACSLQPIHVNAVARFFEGRIYVVNRAGADNIQVLDPYSGFATIRQFTVGIGSDPHDIAFESRTRAFVTRHETDQLWIVDTNAGRRSGQIDFAWLADADGIPEMDHMVRVGNRIFVSVQRLDRNQPLSPLGTSYLAAFDPNTEQFVDADPGTQGTQALALAGAHPFGEMVVNKDSGLIWVASVGRFGFSDGGIEAVNPTTYTTSGLLITEAQLGGDLTDVVAIDENRGAAIISDASSNMLLVGFDLSAPASIDTIYASGGPVLQDAELSRDGRIFVSDRTAIDPGLRVFRSDTFLQLTTSPVDVCLPPADIEFGRR